jgi:hypothetical protein
VTRQGSEKVRFTDGTGLVGAFDGERYEQECQTRAVQDDRNTDGTGLVGAFDGERYEQESQMRAVQDDRNTEGTGLVVPGCGIDCVGEKSHRTDVTFALKFQPLVKSKTWRSFLRMVQHRESLFVN